MEGCHAGLSDAHPKPLACLVPVQLDDTIELVRHQARELDSVTVSHDRGLGEAPTLIVLQQFPILRCGDVDDLMLNARLF